MRRRDLLRNSAVLLAAAPMGGCATLMNLLRQVMKEPTVEITKMSVKEASLTRLTSQFVAVITNPNPFGFSLDGLDYALSIQGSRFAKGDAPGGVNLKPNGTAKTTFDVEFDLGKTASAILDLIGKDTVAYTIDTTFHFQTPKLPAGAPASWKRFSLPASLSGQMPMPKLPKIQVKSFDVRDISVSGIKFRVVSAVENPNAFDVPIDAFEFDVKIGGRRVVSNKTVDGMRLQSKRTSNVPLEFTVSPVDIGLSAIELAQRPNLAWEVATKLESGKLDVPFTSKGNVKLVE